MRFNPLANGRSLSEDRVPIKLIIDLGFDPLLTTHSGATMIKLFTLLVTAVITSSIVQGSSVSAQPQPANESTLTDLCSKTPSDSRCAGNRRAVALDDRPNESGACAILENKVKIDTVCKLAINGRTITVYYEVGEKLSSLDGRKASREFRIQSADIQALRYRETTKDNTTARLLLSVFIRNKKTAEIAIDYRATAASRVEPTPTTVVIVLRRKTGEKLREQLEQMTGLKAEVPVVPQE